MVVSSVAVADGAASVATAAGAITLTATENPVLCGPCAITLWLRVVDLAVTKINTAVIADAINKSKMVTGKSPHLCRSTKKLDNAATVVPLFPPIDQWGALPFPVQQLSPHSLSRRVGDILAGDHGAHRHLPVQRDKDAAPTKPGQAPVHARRVYSRQDSQQA
jgi:hypothetical protein